MQKVAWVIGASTGIGRALALLLSHSGYGVAISARSASNLELVRKEVQESKDFVIFPCDVLNIDSIKAAYAGVIAHYGRVDLIIYAAGIYTPMPLKTFDLQKAHEILQINLGGAFNVFSVIKEHAYSLDPLHLVWIASVAGFRGLPNSGAYGASKAGLISFSEMMRAELAPYNTKVQVVNPGFVKTRLTELNDFPMPMLITPEDAAHYILEGISSNRFNITFPWTFGIFMKILRLMPDFLYFKIAKRML